MVSTPTAIESSDVFNTIPHDSLFLFDVCPRSSDGDQAPVIKSAFMVVREGYGPHRPSSAAQGEEDGTQSSSGGKSITDDELVCLIDKARKIVLEEAPPDNQRIAIFYDRDGVEGGLAHRAATATLHSMFFETRWVCGGVDGVVRQFPFLTAPMVEDREQGGDGMPFYPSQITDQLFISSAIAASDDVGLSHCGVLSVLSLLNRTIPAPSSIAFHRVLGCEDSEDQEMFSVLKEALPFIHHHVQHQRRVLVHCDAGRSRSVTVMCAYLMVFHRLGVATAMEVVRRGRPQAQPNRGFQLFLKHLYESPDVMDELRVQSVNVLQSNRLESEWNTKYHLNKQT